MFGDHIKQHQEFLKAQNDATFQKGGPGSGRYKISDSDWKGIESTVKSYVPSTHKVDGYDENDTTLRVVASIKQKGGKGSSGKFIGESWNHDLGTHKELHQKLNDQGYDVKPDGKHILISKKKSGSDDLEKGEKDKKKTDGKLGKTKSGKDVFADKAPEEYEDFDANDHRDAADLHHEAASKKDSGTFPGHHRAIRNQHTDEAIKGAKKKEKEALKNQPAIGDKITTKEGVGGDVRQRDETHTYIEHKDEEGKVKVSKVKNEDVDSKIAAGHYTHHKPANVKKDEVKKSEDPFDALIKGGPGSGRHKGGGKKDPSQFKDEDDVYDRYFNPIKDQVCEEMGIDEDDDDDSEDGYEYNEDKIMREACARFKEKYGYDHPEDAVDAVRKRSTDGLSKAEINELEKGEKGGGAPIGTIKLFGGREYIKAADGKWKYHGKGGGAAAQGHAADAHDVKVNTPELQSPNDKIAAEKMGDIKQRFKAFAMFTNQVINGKSKSMIAYGTGGVGKTYSVTRQLELAGKRPFDAETMAPGDDTYDYIKITGKMTAPQVYKTLYENNEKIILFDDCDSVLRDGSAINLFKGALDTSGDNVIQYGTSAGVKTDEDEFGETSKIPKRFKFTGRVIFISNLPPDSVPQPLKSRALKVDLSMNKQQTIDRIREIATDPKTGKLTNLRFPGIDKYTSQDLDNVIKYLDKNKDHIGDLNVRTVGKMLGIKQEAGEMGEEKNWESYADQELFSKGEEFNYDGGIMKARQRGIESIYKSKSKVKDYKSEDTTSGIHLSEEQLNDGKKEFKEPKDSEVDNDSDGQADETKKEDKEDKGANEPFIKSIDNAFDKLIK